ncbi:MAG: ATPase domain-containing protein [Candidatus Diapherotrites archaeon]
MPFGIKFPEELLQSEKRAKERETALPLRVPGLDAMISRHGIERGSTLLISGGCGTGKSTLVLQSIYNGMLKGEKAVYISFEQEVAAIKKHARVNFGWDLEKMERERRLFMLRMDPFKIARSVEAFLAQKKGDLLVSVDEIEFPFIPDRIAIDSLSALNIAFMGNMENYRYYVSYMFDMLNRYNSLNFVVSETELTAGTYSKTGIEEFLADGVIVLYNTSENFGGERKRALEILKLRFSEHVHRPVPFKIGKSGISLQKQGM